MTPLDSPAPQSPIDHGSISRSAALASLGLPDELTKTTIRSALLKHLEDEQFFPDDWAAFGTLCLELEGVPVPSSQFFEMYERAALSLLQSLRKQFVKLSPAERRHRWNELNAFVHVVKYLMRILKDLEPGLDWLLSDPDTVAPTVDQTLEHDFQTDDLVARLTAVSQMEYQILAQAMTQFASSPLARNAARIKFFSEAPVTSPPWHDAVEAVLDRHGELFKLVPDFERELRVIHQEASQSARPVSVHQGWISIAQPSASPNKESEC